jgi:hypothetical protein
VCSAGILKIRRTIKLKEINLTLTKENELSFEKPEPYITIHIANKETYEKLVDIIDKDTPTEVEIDEPVLPNSGSYYFLCPKCKAVLSLGSTKEIAKSLMSKCCQMCG